MPSDRVVERLRESVQWKFECHLVLSLDSDPFNLKLLDPRNSRRDTLNKLIQLRRPAAKLAYKLLVFRFGFRRRESVRRPEVHIS